MLKVQLENTVLSLCRSFLGLLILHISVFLTSSTLDILSDFYFLHSSTWQPLAERKTHVVGREVGARGLPICVPPPGSLNGQVRKKREEVKEANLSEGVGALGRKKTRLSQKVSSLSSYSALLMEQNEMLTYSVRSSHRSRANQHFPYSLCTISRK